jgi:hypothetical protein
MDWGRLFALLLGSFLAIIAGLLQEQLKVRRRLRTTARLLLHEIGRLFDYLQEKGIDDDEVRVRLRVAIDDYKKALFDVDAITFSEHYPIYRELVDAIEAPTEFRKEARLILNVRPKLARLLNIDPVSFEDTAG